MKKWPSWLKWGVIGLIIGLIYPLSIAFGFYSSFLTILFYPIVFILIIINPALLDSVSVMTLASPIFYMIIGILLGRIFGQRKPPAPTGQGWIFSKGLLGDSKWRTPLIILILIFVLAILVLFYIGSNTGKQSGVYGSPEGSTANKKTTPNTNSTGDNLKTNTATNKNNNEQISPSIKIESAKATLERSDGQWGSYCTVELSGTVTGPTCATMDTLQFGDWDLENGGLLMSPLLCSDWVSQSQWCTRNYNTLNQPATTKWSVTMKNIYFPERGGKLFAARLGIPKLPLPLFYNGNPHCSDSEKANRIVVSTVIPTCN